MADMVREMSMGELAALQDAIDAERMRRELAERESEVRQVVDERRGSSGTLRLERVRCGKDRCQKCERGEGHGPYWYLSFRRNGKLASKYVGKVVPPELEA